MHRRISVRGVAVIALAAAAIALTPGIAFADPAAPPGWVDQGPGLFIGFKLDNPSPAQHRGGGSDPVNLSYDTNLTPDQLKSAVGWEVRDNPDPTPDQYLWPAQFVASGVTLERVSECDYSQTSCQYRIVSGWGSTFWVFGGSSPTDAEGNPQPNPADYSQSIAAQTTPDITFGTVNAVGTADPNGGAGKISVSAAGTADQDSARHVVSYDWVLSTDGKDPLTGHSTAADGAFEWTVDTDGTYCIQLTVTSDDGHQRSSNACSGGTGGDYVFNITGVAPKDPDPGPDPTPTPTPGGGGGGGGPTGGGLFFARPARAPTALTGGGATKPTVVWLWRPEWYNPQLSADRNPQTSGVPKLQAHRDIVVNSGEPKGASAGPWLAGMTAFGLLGGGFLMSRRRRLRMLGDL